MKTYRLLSDTISDVKTYNTNTRSWATGVVHQTGWLVISINLKSDRKIFDFTNGYEGGSNSTLVIHKKPNQDTEMGLWSPLDDRGIYVTGSRQQKTLYTVNIVDGSNRLERFLSSFAGFLDASSWITDSDLCIVGSSTSIFAIVNFMDLSKPAPVYITAHSGNQNTRPRVWRNYKAMLLSDRSLGRSYVYKLLDEMPCGRLCKTCDGVFRNKCLTCGDNASKIGDACVCHAGYYGDNSTPTKQDCKICSSLCATCTGGAATDCSSCRYSLEVKGNGSCDCAERKYRVGTECFNCHPSCRTCSGPGVTECLSCDLGEGVNKQGSCENCAKIDASDCPVETKIIVSSSIEELSQTIQITFIPPLNTNHPTTDQASAQELVEKHLSFNFKRKDTDPDDLKIIKKTLTHGPESSELVVEFLQKMRRENTEYLTLSVKDPWVYKSTDQKAKSTNVVYFKEQEIRIKIENKTETEDEKNQRKVEETAATVKGVLGVSWILVSMIAACTGSSALFAYFIKFFNIIDIMSNLEKINVRFGPRFSLVLKFIQNLKVLELDFLVKLSPLDDSKYDSPDVDAHLMVTRGTRGEMTETNEEIFIMSGANFGISMIIVGIWVVRRMLRACFDERNWVISFLSFVYQSLIGLMFFDFQMISATEISFFDYRRILTTKLKYLGSLLLSILIIILILDDVLKGFLLIQKRIKNEKNEKKDQFSTNDELVLDKYTEGINTTSQGIHNYLGLILNIRFFLIQILISSLQLLNRTQALLILVVNFVYLAFLIRVVWSSIVFSSKLMFVKECVQESCIMLVLVSICIFSFTEKSSFSSSTVYKVLELVAVVSISGAAGSELLMLLTAMCETLASCMKTNTEKVTDLSKKAAKGQEDGLYSTGALNELREESEKMVEGRRKVSKLAEEKAENQGEVGSSRFDYNPFEKIKKGIIHDKVGEKMKRKSKKSMSGVVGTHRVNAFQMRKNLKEKGESRKNNPYNFGTGFPSRVRVKDSKSTVFFNFNEKEEVQK